MNAELPSRAAPNAANRVLETQLQKKIRALLVACAIIIALSGITAFPLTWEVSLLARWLGAPEFGASPANAETFNALTRWIVTVRDALIITDAKFPFLAYGTDWLAFGHLVIASALWGPFKDAVRNIWVIEWAMMACVAVIPLAFICGPIRGIPFAWQLIDCSFGVVGFGPLWLCRRWTKEVEGLQSER